MTFLFKLLANLVRSREQIVLACAYSGLAASNYRGGSTFHFRYKFPVPFDATSTSGLKPNGINAEAAKYVSQAVLLLGDEASTIPKLMLGQIDAKHRALRGNDKPFGGMNVVLCGDFCQTLPILPQALRNTVINNCIVFHPLWQKFVKLRLTINMRVNADEIAFKEFLGQVGRGELPRYKHMAPQLIRLPNELILEGRQNPITGENLRPTEEDLIAHVYGEPFDNESRERRAILCPLNVDALRINEACLRKVPGLCFILRFYK